MNNPKQLLLAGLLLLTGVAIPGAGAGVIQLSPGTTTPISWSGTDGAIPTASIYLEDGMGYYSSSYYSGARGNLCGMVFAFQAPAGEELKKVTVDVTSLIASDAAFANSTIYGTYKAGGASLAPGQTGTQFIWDFWTPGAQGNLSLFSHVGGGDYGNAPLTNTITFDFTGLNYSYFYTGFFVNNNDTYNPAAHQLFVSANGNPGLEVTSVIPEPATLGLLALGGLALLRRRRG